MDYRTFQADTMSAALAEVKQELGPERRHPAHPKLHRKSLARPAPAGNCRDHRRSRRPRRRIAPAAPARQPAPAPAARQTGCPIRAANSSKAPPAQNAAMLGLVPGSRPDSKTMVKDLVDQGHRTAVARRSPRNFSHFYSQLIENQVAEELAARHDQNPAKADSARARSASANSSDPEARRADRETPARRRSDRPHQNHRPARRRPDRPHRRRQNHHPRQARRQSQAPREAPRRADHARHLSHRRHRSAQEIRRHHRLAPERRRHRRGTVAPPSARWAIANSSSSTPPAAAPTTP